MILNEDISPQILKTLTLNEKIQLCGEIRNLLIEIVSKNGGHLASNLGTVELIVTMHSVFETPRDKFVFDVGHQAYTHKILTGRMSKFDALRTEDGISGFPRPSESEHDAFIGGHSSISVSAALGISNAMKLKGEKGSVIAVVGDGALTGGEIYEGINNTCEKQDNLIIVLNDNEMSISKSRGAVASYLSRIRSTKKYYQTKTNVKNVLSKNIIGRGISNTLSGAKHLFKNIVIQENLFENLGLKYFGPIDGHNIEELTDAFELAQLVNGPCLIHVKTKKGKGYIPAEENSGQYHGIDRKNDIKNENEQKNSVKSKKRVKNKPYINLKTESYNEYEAEQFTSRISFSEAFGREIRNLGEKDDRICVITAAMKYATGCNYFAKEFKDRFFDAGIAEGHAVTFAAGLAVQNFIPVFAVYSTFLQRGYDQLLHDAAIEGLHIVLAIDRAGLNGEDGETHLGIFDVPFLTSIPGTTIFSPSCIEEQKLCLKKAIYETNGISAVRYPRGIAKHADYTDIRSDYRYIKAGETKAKTLFITFGRLYYSAKKLLSINIDLLLLIQIHPLPKEAEKIIKGYDKIIFFEESIERGGIAEALALRLLKSGWSGEFKSKGVEGFVKCADAERQIKLCGLDYEAMEKTALEKG